MEDEGWVEKGEPVSYGLKMPESKLRMFVLRYEMTNGWLMLLAWIPLPEWIAQKLANYYLRKADRKIAKMSREHINDILKGMK